MTSRSLFLGLCLLGLGCHTGHPPAEPTPAALPGELTLRVVNHGRFDVVIYLIHSGSRERIGESIASATTSFKIALRRMGAGRSYSLYGDPVGSVRVSAQTETLVAEEGQLVIWTLEDDLRRSSVEVR